jgi:hypothetical protein
MWSHQDHRVPRAPLPGVGVTHHQGDLSRHLGGRYPSIIPPTGSCARPRSSPRLGGPRSWGLCRLSRVSAGLWPFPTLSLPSVWRYLDPYPAVFVRCTCPSLPQRQRPHVTGNTFGTRDNPCKAISTGSVVSGLQSFAHVHAPTLARPPDRSHRSRSTGRPGRLHHAWPEGLPTSGCGIATCLHGHLTRLDLHQLDGSLVGCSFPHSDY